MQAPCLQKRFSDYFWQNRRLLEFLNDDTKLILNNQEGHSDSFRINLESIRTFRGLLFHKKMFGRELFWKHGSTGSRFFFLAVLRSEQFSKLMSLVAHHLDMSNFEYLLLFTAGVRI